MTFKLRTFSKIQFIMFISAFAFLTMIIQFNTDMVLASNLVIQNVKINQNTLRPGENLLLSFSLNYAATTSIKVYTPDYDVVRHLIKDQVRPAGISTIVWDGRDDSGIMVPDEAYFFGITAKNTNGGLAVYNPTVVSGGEISDVHILGIENFEGGQYRVSYSVPVSSRINLRAGVHDGPMLKTLIDWQPVPAGEYVLQWDGMDDNGKFKVMTIPGIHLSMEGFSLPENSVIVQNSSDNYFKYRKNLKQDEQEQKITFQTARRSIMNRINQGVSSQSLVKRSLSVAPEFTVYLNDDFNTGLAERSVTDVSGEIRLVVSVNQESMDAFNETRYEIIVFIDNVRFDEEEHAHSPYTYTLDTKKLSNGNHMVTMNQASLNGQVGSYSFKINVNN